VETYFSAISWKKSLAEPVDFLRQLQRKAEALTLAWSDRGTHA
jgi:hypothetical protein